MLVPMAKVEIIGHREYLDATLHLLHRLQAVQLIDVTAVPDVKLPPLTVDEPHQRELEDLRYLGLRLDSVLKLIPESDVTSGEATAGDLRQLRTDLEELSPEIETLTRRLDAQQSEQATLPRYVESLRRLLPLVPELPRLTGYETAAVLIESRHARVLGDLNAEMGAAVGDQFDIITAPVDADTTGAILVFPRQASAQVYRVLGKEQVSRVRLPKEFEGMPFRQAVAAMERRLVELPTEIEATERAIVELVRPRAGWRSTRAAIVARIDQLEAIRSLGTTQHTFVAVGWVPRTALASLRAELDRNIGARVILHEIKPAGDEQPPVMMRNLSLARPFEFLVALLSPPAYGAFDPTLLMLVFFPLFFGMMLGDIAYGLIVLGLAWWTGRRYAARSPVVRDLCRILLYGAVWSVVWGVIYGELFGNLGHDLLGLEPIWINREEAVQPLLLFAVAVGAVHVILGLVIGVWTAARSRQRHELAERLGILVALIGLFLIVGVAAERLPDGLLTPAIAGVIVGLAVLISLQGFMGILLGPLELVSSIGNVLSYLRLGAIGLASVYLARVANELAGAGPVWMGVIVAALFHALNLVLGTFSPTIQALRLHYVEFFGKFYQEGGRPFRPFGLPHLDTQERK